MRVPCFLGTWNWNCLVHQAAKIRMWLTLGTKPPGKSGVKVLIFLKCLNGLITCWVQAGYRNVICCAACSDLTGFRNRWMHSWLLHIPRKYSKSVTSIIKYRYIGCCATCSDLGRKSWSTNWWLWSYLLSVLYTEIVGNITALSLLLWSVSSLTVALSSRRFSVDVNCCKRNVVEEKL